MSELIERDYSYHAAGRVWRVPELHLVRMPDGTVALSKSEIDRIHRSVANVVCGNSDPLTIEELDFLCDITVTTRAEAARHLGLHPSTLSKWRGSRQATTILVSRALKWWFWFRIFGPELERQRVTIGELPDESHFLDVAHRKAIQLHVVDPIEPQRAA